MSNRVKVKKFSRRDTLRKFIQNIELKNHVVLVKGSNRMKMIEFVEEIRKKEI